MVVLCVAGILPLLGDPKILSATTASGTYVMGLGPPIYMLALLPKDFFTRTVRPLAFHVPVWSGVIMGIVYQLSRDKCCKDDIDITDLDIGTGSYRSLLGVNVAGAGITLLLYVIFMHDACWGHYEKETAAKQSPVAAMELSKQLDMVEGAPATKADAQP